MFSWFSKLWSWLTSQDKVVEEEPMSIEQQKLSHLLRGLMDAVQDSSTVVGQQFIHQLNTYFETEGEHLVPKYVRIQVSEDNFVDVPLFTLITPRSYTLSEFEVDLSIKLLPAEVKKAAHSSVKSAAKRASYKVEVCPSGDGSTGRRQDVVNVKVKFESSDAPESVMRVLDELTNSVTPKPRDQMREVPLMVFENNRTEMKSATSSSSSSDDFQDGVDTEFVLEPIDDPEDIDPSVSHSTGNH